MEIPRYKTTSFVFLGIILFLGISYLDMPESEGKQDMITLSGVLISIGIAAQIMNWGLYWYKKLKTKN